MNFWIPRAGAAGWLLAGSALLSGCAVYDVPYNDGIGNGSITTGYGPGPYYDNPAYGTVYGAPYGAPVYGSGVTIYGSSGYYPGTVYGGPVYPNSPQYRRNPGNYRPNGDIDRDGIPNRLDRDRDGDGIANRADRHPNRGPRDRNGDGVPDNAVRDRNGDGVPDRPNAGWNNGYGRLNGRDGDSGPNRQDRSRRDGGQN